jgi:hypothetical protein
VRGVGGARERELLSAHEDALGQPTAAARGRSARIRTTRRSSCGWLDGASPATTSVPGDQVRPPLNSYALAVLPELRNLRILRREVGHD